MYSVERKLCGRVFVMYLQVYMISLIAGRDFFRDEESSDLIQKLKVITASLEITLGLMEK